MVLVEAGMETRTGTRAAGFKVSCDWFENVFPHELGHAFGLFHVETRLP